MTSRVHRSCTVYESAVSVPQTDSSLTVCYSTVQVKSLPSLSGVGTTSSIGSGGIPGIRSGEGQTSKVRPVS